MLGWRTRWKNAYKTALIRRPVKNRCKRWRMARGLYKMKSWDQASDEFVLERFEEYWGRIQIAICHHQTCV